MSEVKMGYTAMASTVLLVVTVSVWAGFNMGKTEALRVQEQTHPQKAPEPSESMHRAMVGGCRANLIAIESADQGITPGAYVEIPSSLERLRLTKLYPLCESNPGQTQELLADIYAQYIKEIHKENTKLGRER
ncbi:hypothetical protein [Deefgea salmonis]|uniref:Uncharacterized protein n=1 Tax=Deefgea salmonis TaxID=2875502 RepID=A0ABS8BI62_9NEIS|nr:hypothetical protein [Deefgea salmonis]MCB5195314.1 hypothetical protein [Deefgea salmonis]